MGSIRPGSVAGAALAVMLAVIPAAGGPGARAAAAPAPADQALYERLSQQVMGLYDESRGGFVRKDGTPCEPAIELALARGEDGDTLALGRALRTLRWMHSLLDTVGGGYFEGARDVDHATDSFEKRTDSNLRRLGLLAAVADRPGETFERDARRVLDYCQRLLMDGRGGFQTSQIGSRDLEPATNGVALRGWWGWAARSGDPRLRDFAFRSFGRLWRECRDDRQGFVRRDTWGKVIEPTLLADQAEMGLAFLRGWQASGRDSDLVRARVIAAHVREHHEDAARGGFRNEYVAEAGKAKGGSRPFEENAVAARFLAELGAATGEESYTSASRRAWAAFEKQFEKPQFESAEWALAIRATWARPAMALAEWRPEEKDATPRVTSFGRRKGPSGRK